MGGACNTHGETRSVCKILVGQPEGNRPFGNLVVGGRIILKWILGKQGLGRGLDSPGSG
jgi:hypothetical protein